MQGEVPVVEGAREPEDSRGRSFAPGRIGGGGLALLLRPAAVDPPAVEAPREVVGAVDGPLVLGPQAAAHEGVDARDEDRGAGARGVRVAGEDGREVEVEVVVEVEGRRGRRRGRAAPASVCFVVFLLVVVVVEIVVIVIVRHAVYVVDKVLVDVVVVGVVVGVLLE